jgi:uncharacterized lipoprotein YddW (UPF0748 family)
VLNHLSKNASALVAIALLTATGCMRLALPPDPVPQSPVTITPPVTVVLPVVATPTPVPHYTDSTDPVALPVVPRELRGVWIATIGNMDWPSRRNLTTSRAKEELVRILDAAQANGLNVVILQIRPMGDAFYESQLEPWSDYLTGASGRQPNPYWDPLQFAIDQAHARGLELHAWFNPFRVGIAEKQTPFAESHITKHRPDLIVRYGSQIWLDPGEPEARAHTLAVFRDVVRRYDIDAVHIDDYFYPYQERDRRNRLIEFADDASWSKYGASSGLSRADWRRSNMNTFIAGLYATVHNEKRHVRVGISPFGIWRPGSPPAVRGLDSYSELFADTRKWLVNGWTDYYAPQLYWKTHAPQQDYAQLLQWWSEQNAQQRTLVAGNITDRVGGTNGWPAREILEQVDLTRESGVATGNIFFNAGSMLRDRGGVYDSLRTNQYVQTALVPASPWLSDGPAAPPQLDVVPDAGLHATALTFTQAGAAPSRWIVHTRFGETWRTLLLPGATREVHVDWKNGAEPDVIAVLSVDRAGVESRPRVLRLSDAQAR